MLFYPVSGVTSISRRTRTACGWTSRRNIPNTRSGHRNRIARGRSTLVVTRIPIQQTPAWRCTSPPTVPIKLDYDFIFTAAQALISHIRPHNVVGLGRRRYYKKYKEQPEYLEGLKELNGFDFFHCTTFTKIIDFHRSYKQNDLHFSQQTKQRAHHPFRHKPTTKRSLWTLNKKRNCLT